MTWITDEVLARVGVWSEPLAACDPVEPGAVRRFVQAIMDDDPAYGPLAQTPWGGPVAPPLFPNHMLRRPWGADDVLQQRAHEDSFDGVVPGLGLPPIPQLSDLAVLNGGSEFEFFRYALHGERIRVRQRYADIHEKHTTKRVMIVVVIEGEIQTEEGQLLLRSRRTLLRRVPA